MTDWREASLNAFIGPGWEPLVDRAWAAMLEHDPAIEPHQVKEKFGLLRIYWHSEASGSDVEAIQRIADDAARKAVTICEVCGERGRLREELPWIKTLCDRHTVRVEAGGHAVLEAFDEERRRRGTYEEHSRRLQLYTDQVLAAIRDGREGSGKA